MWSTGSWELLHHICVGLMPLVGGTKKPSSAPPAPPAGTSWCLKDNQMKKTEKMANVYLSYFDESVGS